MKSSTYRIDVNWSPPPRNEISCVHTGVVGRVFDAHVIEGNGECIKPVSGTALQPIEDLL